MGRAVGAAGRELNLAEIWELISGPQEGGSAFASEADRAVAWQHHGTELVRGGYYPPGDRAWAYWRHELGVEEPATRLERAKLLDERGLLSVEERRQVAADAREARKRWRGGHVVTSPREAAERVEGSLRAAEDEKIQIAEAIGEG